MGPLDFIGGAWTTAPICSRREARSEYHAADAPKLPASICGPRPWDLAAYSLPGAAASSESSSRARRGDTAEQKFYLEGREFEEADDIADDRNLA